MNILVGTNNENKLTQFRRVFQQYLPEVTLFSLRDVGITEDVEEDEDSLIGNAKKKAQFFGEKSGMLTLADDTGLFIDALNGEPGVHAKRWLEGTEEERYIKILERMKDVPQRDRTCRYKGVLAVYNPTTKEVWTYEGNLEGEISLVPLKGGGFGYDPIFISTTYGKYYSQLTDGERDAVSHRDLGVQEFAQYLKSIA